MTASTRGPPAGHRLVTDTGRRWHAFPVPSTFAHSLLVTGPEAFLAERAVAAAVEQARAERADVEVSRVAAGELDEGRLAEMTGGSLFSSACVAVIEDIGSLPSELADAVVDLAANPSAELLLILVHPGGVKGKALLDRLRKAAATITDCPAVKPWELTSFVQAEFKRAGGRIDPAGAQALVDAVGSDLRALVGAAQQLLSDADGGVVSLELIRRYFGGRAEVTSFSVADDLLSGREAQAMEKLRWAQETGVAPVLITSACAAALRSLGRYLDARGERRSEAELAREVGVPPWKLKDLARQARSWSEPAIARAIRAVALADGEVKGAATDPGFALEKMLIEVDRCRKDA